jgi:serine/threonine protein kinase
MSKKVGKYELGRTLGEGTFGKVKHAVNVETNEQVAIKVLDKEKIQKQNMGAQIKKEISIMKMVRHKYIVGMKEVLASKTKIFIVLELVTGGELFDKIVSVGKLTEDAALFYFRQLVDGVEYCHRMGVCHRDLKPENLLLDGNGNLKISDFGLSSLYVGDADSEGSSRTELLHTTCGTPNYVAPEVLADKGYDGKKADVWSIGVIMYVLLAGFLPFDEPTIVALFAKIQNADFSYPSIFSDQARNLLDQILVSDPAQRISLTEVRNHPMVFVEGADAEDIPEQCPVVNADDAVQPAAESSSSAGGGLEGTKKSSWRKQIGNKTLNAFDLMNICGGFALDRLFIPSGAINAGATTGRRLAGLQYTSSKDPATLVQAVKDQLAALACDIDEETSGSTRVKASKLSPKGLIGITADVYVLTGNLSLLEFRRGKGDLLEFRNLFSELTEQLFNASHIRR